MKRALRRVTVSLRFAAALGAALTLLLPHSVVAQSDDAATLADFRACGALQRDSARLACFDGVLAADREGGGVDEIAEPAPVTEAAVREDSPVAAEPAETRVATAPELESEPAASRAAPAPRPELAEAATENVASSEPIDAEAARVPAASPSPGEPDTASPAEPAPAQVASAPAGEAGATQAAGEARTVTAEVPPANQIRTAAAQTRAAAPTVADSTDASAFTIVEMTTRIPGAARFITDDGRVFVQTSGGSNYRNFPDAPFPATLEDGALGSSFLRLGPRLRVRVRIVE